MPEKGSPPKISSPKPPYGRQALEIALGILMLRTGQNIEQTPNSRTRWLIERALSTPETEV